MFYEYNERKLGSILGLTSDYRADRHKFSITDNTVKILWNRGNEPAHIMVDDLKIVLNPKQIMTVTFLQHLRFPKPFIPLTGFVFNREFYCLFDHDHEVSCNGVLFFGTQDLPIITLDESEKSKFDLLLNVFAEEFATRDNIQGEMLQMLLKRLIIKCTRLAKEQLIVKELSNSQIEVVREFNMLVDLHYKEKRQVSEYAAMMNKSPKTLSNLFSIYNDKSPQHVIAERVVLEAKRMLLLTDLSSKEIAHELGFSDPAHFTKFFRKTTGITPSKFAESEDFMATGKS